MIEVVAISFALKGDRDMISLPFAITLNRVKERHCMVVTYKAYTRYKAKSLKEQQVLLQ